jgi:hypothetical protein
VASTKIHNFYNATFEIDSLELPVSPEERAALLKIFKNIKISKKMLCVFKDGRIRIKLQNNPPSRFLFLMHLDRGFKIAYSNEHEVPKHRIYGPKTFSFVEFLEEHEKNLPEKVLNGLLFNIDVLRKLSSKSDWDAP